MSGLTPEPPLLPLEPGQCLIISDMDVLRADGELWLHNLSLRLLSTARALSKPVLVEAFGGEPSARLTSAARSAEAAAEAALSPAAAAVAAEAEEERRAAVWMTRVAIQGDGAMPAQGVRVTEADLYAEGVPAMIASSILNSPENIPVPPPPACRTRHVKASS